MCWLLCQYCFASTLWYFQISWCAGALGNQELPKDAPAALARRSKSTVLQRAMSSLWTWQRRRGSISAGSERDTVYAALTKDQLAEVRPATNSC